ncbi:MULTISPECIES: DUF262 domain-containing protein [Streptomyces]|uniref:DUF262 domain-containing protein n=1 Tax=Streptomyces TaxID=1883 RepID=UPI002930BD8D|nr:DUF262 domain-containing protein [Streptomyces sp. NEAU-HV9]
MFCSDYDFRIPQYPRPSAWEADQAQQLLGDLSEAMDGGSDEPYFLGSIVLVKQQFDSVAQVINGQQRLTFLISQPPCPDGLCHPRPHPRRRSRRHQR